MTTLEISDSKVKPLDKTESIQNITDDTKGIQDTTDETKKRITDGLNLKDAFRNKPKMSLSNFSENNLQLLENQLDKEKLEGLGLVAVVRCWNKSEADLIEFLEKMQKFQKSIPDLKGIFVSINSDGEDDNFTENNLKNALEKVSLDIPVVPIGINGYSWTAGLNAPVALLNQITIGKNIDQEKIRVMNISFGVDISEDELKKCNNNIHTNKYTLTARKTSDGANPFTNNENGDQLWKKFKEIIRYPNEADLAELAYTMRNTFNIIPLNDIIELGGFNPLCNGESREFTTNQASPFYNHISNSKETKVTIRGMEDAEFFMRLILNAINSGKIEIIKELKTSMNNPVFYNDKDWNKMHELTKMKKIANEMQALSLIISGIATSETISTGQNGERRTIGLVKNMYVPKAMQDFDLSK